MVVRSTTFVVSAVVPRGGNGYDEAMADQTESAPIFGEEGTRAREQLRVALHEAAVALRRDREDNGDQGQPSEQVLRERIAALGFAGAAAKIFDLLPLVHVAWADGEVQYNERAEIIGLLRVRGIPLGPAYSTMLALLEEKPSPEYMDESLAVLRDLVERGESSGGQTIVGQCIAVARAAGGFLGIDPVSEEEKQAIEYVAGRLGDAAMEEFRKRMG